MAVVEVDTRTVEIHLAQNQGFCAGVSSAIDVVNLALEKYGAPLYVRHAIVHNNKVIEDFEAQGVIFIEDLAEVPDDETVIFSAHGTAPEVFEKARRRNLNVIDATCPLVTKVHRQAVRFSEKNIQTVLIGHKGHQELIGTSGYVNQKLLHIVENEEDVDTLDIDPKAPIGFLTQTTLSVNDTEHIIKKLRAKYPHIQGPPKTSICYATQNRQDSISDLANFCDLIIVCGSPHSSNSNRLKETAEALGVTSYIIDTAAQLELDWLEGRSKIGISSGASVPREIVDQVVRKIKTRIPFAPVYQKESVEKGIKFAIPEI